MLNVPAAHFEQAAELAALNFPASHSVQVADPAALNFPAEHSEHRVFSPVSSLKVPGRHCLHCFVVASI